MRKTTAAALVAALLVPVSLSTTAADHACPRVDVVRTETTSVDWAAIPPHCHPTPDPEVGTFTLEAEASATCWEDHNGNWKLSISYHAKAQSGDKAHGSSLEAHGEGDELASKTDTASGAGATAEVKDDAQTGNGVNEGDTFEVEAYAKAEDAQGNTLKTSDSASVTCGDDGEQAAACALVVDGLGSQTHEVPIEPAALQTEGVPDGQQAPGASETSASLALITC